MKAEREIAFLPQTCVMLVMSQQRQLAVRNETVSERTREDMFETTVRKT